MRCYPCDTAREQYWAYITTGTHDAWCDLARQLPRSDGHYQQLGHAGRWRSHRPDIGDAEIQRLQWLWQRHDAHATAASTTLDALLEPDAVRTLDLFDCLQLQAVVDVCQTSSSLAKAGRTLFDQSRQQRRRLNDSDRPRK